MIPLRPLRSLLLFALVGAASAQPNASAERFQFKEPRATSYRVVESKTTATKEWLEAWPENGASHPVQISRRIVVQLQSSELLNQIISGRSLKILRTVGTNGFILQAPDAVTALHEAHRLATLPQVLVSYPVMQRHFAVHNSYAFKPNDSFFPNQWNLENRSSNGTPTGIDLNVRAAWPVTLGEGVIIAVADNGVEYTHPELATRAAGSPHTNFVNGTSSGLPVTTGDIHGTAVAGLAVAELNNQLGICGVAPGAKLASWRIINNNSLAIDDQQQMNMFQYLSNSVAVQNHSWGVDDVVQLGPDWLTSQGIDNAVQLGRGGRGVVMVRSSGNLRFNFANANDDGYASNPEVIAVTAARSDGRAAHYSNPGACLLVAAPSQETSDNFGSRDPSFPALFTTDRQGTAGYNTSANTNDYVFDGSFGFTSAAAPQISGVAALILSANTNLGYRDVQQILLQSSRHFDLSDPDMITNGAGFRVSHNVGFGIPDAGFAVALAKQWTNRPPLTNLTFTATNTFTSDNPAAIPDDGLRVVITNAPSSLQLIPATPSVGPHPDVATAFLPLIEVTNLATNAITQNLTNKAAFIQRGNGTFATKIQNAANAGASFAVIYNTNTPGRLIMNNTDFLPIPAVFISYNDGTNLLNYIHTNGASVQLNLLSTNYSFSVTNTLSCEHVGVRVQTDHQRRADVRITLLSPSGTRSVLQRLNNDTNSVGPIDWTYYSTHHFYESSYGNWIVAFSDEAAGATGAVQSVSLILYGVPITDTDHDGLDDNWEKANFTNSLAFGPKDDQDKDGFNNMREQIMGINPNKADAPFQLDLSRWDNRLARLSWASSSNFNYEVRSGTNVASFSTITNLPGQFPQTEFFISYTNSPPQFFNLRAVPAP